MRPPEGKAWASPTKEVIMILITGAAGTVGSEVVKGLMAAGARVRVGYRNRKPDAPGADAVPFDFDRPEMISPALAGVEKVFLLSNIVSHELNLVRAAKAAGVRHVVKLSVWRAHEEAYSFARWHRPVELELEGSGLAWTFLRPNLFMQNTVNFMGETIRRDGAFYMPSGSVRVSQIDARDIAAVAVQALSPVPATSAAPMSFRVPRARASTRWTPSSPGCSDARSATSKSRPGTTRREPSRRACQKATPTHSSTSFTATTRRRERRWR
jgi:hypothetical protein